LGEVTFFTIGCTFGTFGTCKIGCTFETVVGAWEGIAAIAGIAGTGIAGAAVGTVASTTCSISLNDMGFHITPVSSGKMNGSISFLEECKDFNNFTNSSSKESVIFLKGNKWD
jgi:hypothetical protein